MRDYLEIESTRFGQRLRYEIAVPDTSGDCQGAAAGLQTLVENSVKHVVAQRSKAFFDSDRGAQRERTH